MARSEPSPPPYSPWSPDDVGRSNSQRLLPPPPRQQSLPTNAPTNSEETESQDHLGRNPSSTNRQSVPARPHAPLSTLQAASGRRLEPARPQTPPRHRQQPTRSHTQPKRQSAQTTSQDRLVIAVMGPTGSGKSTFINKIAGSRLEVGHTLSSCTRRIASEPYCIDAVYVFS